MADDVRHLSELARELIATCARHLHANDAMQDPVVQAIHQEVADLPHPDMFMQMMAAWAISGERKARRLLPVELFKDRADLRDTNLRDRNGARLLVLRMHETLDLLADPNRPDDALREHLRILTEGYGAAATMSLTYTYLAFALRVANYQEVALEDVVRDWFLDEVRALEDDGD